MKTLIVLKRFPVTLTLGLSILLSACSTDSQQQTANISWQPVTLSEHVGQLYQSQCHNCHGLKEGGAPLTGDTQAWNSILAKGFDQTLENAINGYGGMPPNGLCFECTPEQMQQLIRYMSNPAN